MVEFDDGDRGWISLSNIRLLPPGYQIHCTFLQINTFHLQYKQRVSCLAMLDIVPSFHACH